MIHRDLKPSNVIVGSFGEVQVMDWGLAKVLREAGVADEPSAEPAPELSVIATVRSGSDGDDSEAGSVLGTPAYMAPEQASGELERVDRRADVFGLGSILCEILTGQPAYTGTSHPELIRKAMRGETANALTRLDGCGAEAELVSLAKDCLAVEPDDRPRDAGVVAERVTAYLAGVQARVQAAERDRAVAVARAVEERRRHKLQLGLAAALLAFTTLGGLSTAYYLQQRQARAAAIEQTVSRAVTLRDQAAAHPEDVARWQVALAALEQAEAGAGGAEPARDRLLALRTEVQAGLDGAQRDRALLDRLVDIRSAKADDPAGSATDAAYADAFGEAGLALAALPPAEVGAKIKARPSAVALGLAAALDDWASVRRSLRKDTAGAKRLSQAAQTIDPDPWRNDLRAALDQPDKQTRLAAVSVLTKTAQFDLDQGNLARSVGDEVSAGWSLLGGEPIKNQDFPMFFAKVLSILQICSVNHFSISCRSDTNNSRVGGPDLSSFILAPSMRMNAKCAALFWAAAGHSHNSMHPSSRPKCSRAYSARPSMILVICSAGSSRSSCSSKSLSMSKRHFLLSFRRFRSIQPMTSDTHPGEATDR